MNPTITVLPCHVNFIAISWDMMTICHNCTKLEPHKVLISGVRGLEKALDHMEVGLEQDTSASEREPQFAATPRDVRRVMMRERRAAAWRHLNVLERDVIIVFSALCKVRIRYWCTSLCSTGM